MALSVSHPVSTRDTNIILRALARGLIRDVIRKEPYHIMFIIYLNMRKSCSVLWTFSHVINIILKGMIKGWWYRYQSRQTNTVVMFFQYYICKFPLFSTKYMINTEYYMSKSVSHAVSTREPYITPRAIRHVIQILTCNVHYITYFNHAFDYTCIL
jgi:hypothetical protein